MNGGRIAGIIAIVLSLVAGVGGILYISQHPHRGLALLVVFIILLAVGILLIIFSGRKSSLAVKQK
jgi:hypothetical protein